MRSFRFAPIAGTAIVVALLVIPVPAMATEGHPGAGEGVEVVESGASCTKWTSGNRAYANCTVTSGRVRLRADCVSWPDQYSAWKGTGTWNLSTGSCPLGIRRAIIETS